MNTAESIPSPPTVPTRPQRRWYQFSLLTLLILVAVVAVGTKMWMVRIGKWKGMILAKSSKFFTNHSVFVTGDFDIQYSNTWQGKYYHSISMDFAPYDLLTEVAKKEIFTDETVHHFNLDEPIYICFDVVWQSAVKDRSQLDEMRSAWCVPKSDSICRLVTTIENHDLFHWCNSDINGKGLPILLSDDPKVIYLSGRGKVLQRKKANIGIFSFLQMQEIQLADVTPELRPRVEEELNKLIAE